ncbi:MAG: hypothetical protein HY726_20620 [Candidatus Rokubacteria bacterium]|nr:hypothetical protein [Candidatus Rokubacteria bacterium]
MSCAVASRRATTGTLKTPEQVPRGFPQSRSPEVLLLTLTRDGRVADPTALEKIEQGLPSVTDCFLFCHGWLNDRAEAREGAARFFGALERWLQKLRDRVAPLRLALHWPSKPFADPELARGALDDGLWPELERLLLASPTRTETQALRRLLRELIEAEIPLAPEEEAELDRLLRLLSESRGALFVTPFQALSFWVMKRRAGQVGERFGRERWAPLWERLRSRPRLYLIGHSFGAKLVSSMVLGGARPTSLVLLQAAFSAFAFAPQVPGYNRPGFYHRVLAERHVAGPIVAVRSVHDTALRVLYPLVTGSGQVDRGGRGLRTRTTVARSAMGAVGALGVGATEVELRLTQRIGIPLLPVVNVDGSAVVRASELLVGAHLDIYHREVAALVLLAGGLLQGHPEGLRPRPVTPGVSS